MITISVVTIQNYYNIIDYIPYAVLFIPVIILLTGNLYLLIPLPIFTHPPTPTPLATTSLFSVFMSLFSFLFFVF